MEVKSFKILDPGHVIGLGFVDVSAIQVDPITAKYEVEKFDFSSGFSSSNDGQILALKFPKKEVWRLRDLYNIFRLQRHWNTASRLVRFNHNANVGRSLKGLYN